MALSDGGLGRCTDFGEVVSLSNLRHRVCNISASFRFFLYILDDNDAGIFVLFPNSGIISAE
jgi:hypothetical protein